MLQVRPSPVSTPVRLQAEGEGPKSAHEDSRPNFQSFHNIFCVIASRLEAIASTNEPEGPKRGSNCFSWPMADPSGTGLCHRDEATPR